VETCEGAKMRRWAPGHVFILERVDMFLRHITANENVRREL